MISAFSSIARTEGAFAFYKGLTPSVALIAPQIGAVFACYEFFHDVWCESSKKTTNHKISGNIKNTLLSQCQTQQDGRLWCAVLWPVFALKHWSTH